MTLRGKRPEAARAFGPVSAKGGSSLPAKAPHGQKFKRCFNFWPDRQRRCRHVRRRCGKNAGMRPAHAPCPTSLPEPHGPEKSSGGPKLRQGTPRAPKSSGKSGPFPAHGTSRQTPPFRVERGRFSPLTAFRARTCARPFSLCSFLFPGRRLFLRGRPPFPVARPALYCLCRCFPVYCLAGKTSPFHFSARQL